MTSTFHISSAYGGDGWQPRTQSLAEEMGAIWGQFGVNNEWAPLQAVLLHRPGPELAASTDPESVQYVAPVDAALAGAQHDAMAQAYRDAGVIVHYLDAPPLPKPNQMFMADLMFMTPEGVILARPASTVRAGEERIAAATLAALGVPIVRSVGGRGVFEGADAMWLDPQTVLIGRGLRTNDAGALQVSGILREMGVDSVIVDLPFGSMHLMGVIRLADHDLAIGFPGRLAHRAVDLLRSRNVRVAFLPDEHEAHHCSALNFVTLGPREILMVGNAPVTQRFYEGLGIRCHPVEMQELRKAAGAIGCLSGILQRERC